MKKRQILAIGAAVVMAVSCNTGGNIPTKVALNSGTDSLAYLYGVDRVAQGLENYLYQMRVLSDTSEIRFRYIDKIQDAETDEQKEALTKMMQNSVDSVQRINEKNMADFYAGLKKGFNSSSGDAAYLRGQDIGGQLRMMMGDFAKNTLGEEAKDKMNKEAFLAGVVATMKKEKPQIENPQLIFQAKMKSVQEEQLKKQYADKLAENQKYLDDNKSKEGVVVLPSGLQYKIIKEGTGDKPEAVDKVKVDYHGTLIDGTVFDSSVQRGKPVDFGVRQVIPGWTEALLLMPVGSKWQIYVPYDLAYGSRGTNTIPPFSTLIFDVELLGFEKPADKKK